MAQLSNNYYNFVIIKLCISYLCFIPGDRYMIEAYNISKAPAIVVFNSQGWSTDLIFLLPCRFCTMGTNIQPSKECHCLWFIEKRSYTVKEKKGLHFVCFILMFSLEWKEKEKSSLVLQSVLEVEERRLQVMLVTLHSQAYQLNLVGL